MSRFSIVVELDSIATPEWVEKELYDAISEGQLFVASNEDSIIEVLEVHKIANANGLSIIAAVKETLNETTGIYPEAIAGTDMWLAQHGYITARVELLKRIEEKYNG